MYHFQHGKVTLPIMSPLTVHRYPLNPFYHYTHTLYSPNTQNIMVFLSLKFLHSPFLPIHLFYFFLTREMRRGMRSCRATHTHRHTVLKEQAFFRHRRTHANFWLLASINWSGLPHSVYICKKKGEIGTPLKILRNTKSWSIIVRWEKEKRPKK